MHLRDLLYEGQDKHDVRRRGQDRHRGRQAVRPGGQAGQQADPEGVRPGQVVRAEEPEPHRPMCHWGHLLQVEVHISAGASDTHDALAVVRVAPVPDSHTREGESQAVPHTEPPGHRDAQVARGACPGRCGPEVRQERQQEERLKGASIMEEPRHARLRPRPELPRGPRGAARTRGSAGAERPLRRGGPRLQGSDGGHSGGGVRLPPLLPSSS
mmetsp:Transcript_27466/g.71926  ORF Transcript_27466/g.71926 Transcript_27466/m.71926 type:complete len:213 (-) Transcript_27466:59-697(-)